jgi:putative ABC transport system permease protein
MRAWLVALRIARREARRAKGRSALVLALIGLPVLAFTFFAVTYDTFDLTPAEKADREYGTADFKFTQLFDGPVKQEPDDIGIETQGTPKTLTAADVTTLLPAGTRVIPWSEGSAGFRTKAKRGRMSIWELDYADRLAAGILRQVAGRAPANADEVAITREAGKRIGAGVGGTLTSTDGNRTWRIVGLVENPQDLRGDFVVFRPGAAPVPESERYTTWLADTPAPMLWSDVVALNKRGGVGFSRAVALDPPPYDPATMPRPSTESGEAFQIATIFAGALVLEVVLLAAPAFAVGARRRRRDLALVAAAGGSPAHLRRIVLADGIVLGAAAAAIGVVLGAVLAFFGRPLIDDTVMGASPGAFRVFPTALAGLAALAVFSGLLAALVPAWTAARQPVVAALRGLYAVTRLRRRWALLGLVTLLSGIALTAFGASRADDTTSMAGMVLGEIGLVLCTPALVGLVARLGSRFPLSARIALRDVGRNRAAAAPAISAVLAAVAVSTLAGVMIASGTGRYTHSDSPQLVPTGWVTAQVNDRSFGPDQDPPPEPPDAAFPALAAAMSATIPVTTTVPIGRPMCGTETCWISTERSADRKCPYFDQGRLSREQQRAARNDPRCEQAIRQSWGPSFSQVVIDAKDLGTIVSLDGAALDAATAMLRSGGVLVADEFAVSDGHSALGISDDSGEPRKARLPALALPKADSPVVVISPEGIARLGLTVRPAGYIGVTDHEPTQAEEDAFLAAAAKIEGSWQIGVEDPPTPEPNRFLVVLAIVAGFVTIGAAGIATGLAAAEGRADLTTLAAVGASPGVRRMLSLSRTGIVAGLGSALGLLAGLGAAAAVVAGSNRALAYTWPAFEQPMPYVVPWTNVVVSLVVIPVVAMLGAALFTRSKLPIERSRAG